MYGFGVYQDLRPEARFCLDFVTNSFVLADQDDAV